MNPARQRDDSGYKSAKKKKEMDSQNVQTKL